MALILASGSAIRHQMLAAAGIGHRVVKPNVDELALKARGADALALAEAKAAAVGTIHAGEWVIGSDSMVSIDGRPFDKPADRDQATEHLRFFSGKTMILTSAVALARNGKIAWSVKNEARLKVRTLSEQFIRDYLDLEWPDISYCVGVFRLEGPGVQLFETIDGSYFTILGMPLLPLLGALRERGLVAA